MDVPGDRCRRWGLSLNAARLASGVHHLKRYLAKFDFRYSNREVSDFDRATIALQQIEGKRLTYRRINPGPVSY